MRIRWSASLLGILVSLELVLSGCGSSHWSRFNAPPEIQLFSVNGQLIGEQGQLVQPQQAQDGTVISVEPGREVVCLCVATDADRDNLTYTWTASGPAEEHGGTQQVEASATRVATGALLSESQALTGAQGQTFLWTTPTMEGVAYVSCVVEDTLGDADSRTARVRVTATPGNHPPEAVMSPASKILAPLEECDFTCVATDLDNDPLTYAFFPEGNFAAGRDENPRRRYTAPSEPGDHLIYCIVSDGRHNVVALANVTVQEAG